MTYDPSPGLDNLFSAITNDIKAFNPLIEDLITKTTRLHSNFKSLLACYSAFWESLHKLADMGAQSQGCSKSLGASLSRLCTKMSGQDNKMRQICHHLLSSLAQPLQDHLEEWKKQANQMEKEHQKEHKVLRANTKRASQEVQRLQKKLEKRRIGVVSGGGGGIGVGVGAGGDNDNSSSSSSSNNIYLGIGSTPSVPASSGSIGAKSGAAIVKMDRAKAEYCMQHHRLVTLQREHVRRALLLDRQRYCTLWEAMHPLMGCLVSLLHEMSNVEDNLDNLATLSTRGDSLPDDLDSHIRKLLLDNPEANMDDTRSSISLGTCANAGCTGVGGGGSGGGNGGSCRPCSGIGGCSGADASSSDTVSLRSSSTDAGGGGTASIGGGTTGSGGTSNNHPRVLSSSSGNNNNNTTTTNLNTTSRRSSANSLSSSVHSEGTSAAAAGKLGPFDRRSGHVAQVQLQQQLSHEVTAARALRSQNTNGVFSSTRVPSVTSQDSGIASTRDPELYGSALFLRRQIASSVATTAFDDSDPTNSNAAPPPATEDSTSSGPDTETSDDDDEDSSSPPNSATNMPVASQTRGVLPPPSSSSSSNYVVGTQRYAPPISASDQLPFDARHTVSGASAQMFGVNNPHHEMTRPMLSDSTFHLPPSETDTVDVIHMNSPQRRESDAQLSKMNQLQRNYSLRYPQSPLPLMKPSPPMTHGSNNINTINTNNTTDNNHAPLRRMTMADLPPPPPPQVSQPLPPPPPPPPSSSVPVLSQKLPPPQSTNEVTDAELSSELQALDDMLSDIAASSISCPPPLPVMMNSSKSISSLHEDQIFTVPLPVPVSPIVTQRAILRTHPPPPPPLRRGSQISLNNDTLTTTSSSSSAMAMAMKRGSYTPMLHHSASIASFSSQPSKSSSSTSPPPHPLHVKPILLPKPDVSQIIHNSTTSAETSRHSGTTDIFGLASSSTGPWQQHQHHHHHHNAPSMPPPPPPVSQMNAPVVQQKKEEVGGSGNNNSMVDGNKNDDNDDDDGHDANDVSSNPFLAALRNRTQQLRRTPTVRDRSAPAIHYHP